ncbi:hypothetical protein [Streptomyces sp. JJ36]|uniref:hypothetical protein n=1 Tax=Streptomyces sp. JJ36 TaxID=2736645 RepID=UPI001F1763C9|nr:hypothetical protein [Streptomyces sp. JJ36]MCF6523477.1 hypothetical protein [Streptomyces sp. JJ36]
MISFITTARKTDRSAVSTCLLGSRFDGTGVSGVVLGGRERLLGNERPTKAPAAAAKAQACAYAFGFAANGAGEGRQKQQHHLMWAIRGHEPWRDPA